MSKEKKRRGEGFYGSTKTLDDLICKNIPLNTPHLSSLGNIYQGVPVRKHNMRTTLEELGEKFLSRRQTLCLQFRLLRFFSILKYIGEEHFFWVPSPIPTHKKGSQGPFGKMTLGESTLPSYSWHNFWSHIGYHPVDIEPSLTVFRELKRFIWSNFMLNTSLMRYPVSFFWPILYLRPISYIYILDRNLWNVRSILHRTPRRRLQLTIIESFQCNPQGHEPFALFMVDLKEDCVL